MNTNLTGDQFRDLISSICQDVCNICSQKHLHRDVTSSVIYCYHLYIYMMIKYLESEHYKYLLIITPDILTIYYFTLTYNN